MICRVLLRFILSGAGSLHGVPGTEVILDVPMPSMRECRSISQMPEIAENPHSLAPPRCLEIGRWPDGKWSRDNFYRMCREPGHWVPHGDGRCPHVQD